MAAEPDPTDSLEIYLNDHLAGATAALELMDDIVDGATDEELRGLLQDLRAEVEEDREQLEVVMERLGVSTQRFKQVLASLAESTSRLKLARVGAPDELSELLELESLSAGVWMKKRLWRALASSSGLAGSLEGIDLEELANRADRQLDAIERHRLRLVPRALGT